MTTKQLLNANDHKTAAKCHTSRLQLLPRVSPTAWRDVRALVRSVASSTPPAQAEEARYDSLSSANLAVVSDDGDSVLFYAMTATAFGAELPSEFELAVAPPEDRAALSLLREEVRTHHESMRDVLRLRETPGHERLLSLFVIVFHSAPLPVTFTLWINLALMPDATPAGQLAFVVVEHR